MPPTRNSAKVETPQIGRPAPAFDLPAFPEGRISLRVFEGKKNVILYFYPRDKTPGCTTEACDFRDRWTAFDSYDTVVLGISTDSVQSHQRFAEKYALPFALLCDETHEICEKYGVWVEKRLYGKRSMGVQRATFLIDKSGKVAAAWPKVSVKGHADEVMAAVANLRE